MRKQVVAFIAAFVITGCVALVMLIVGASALLNPNGVAVSSSPAAVVSAPSNSGSSQAQIAQLQNQIAQYQTALNNDNQQLRQAAQEMQMVQQLLVYLQNHGLIQIDNQGQITVTGGSGN